MKLTAKTKIDHLLKTYPFLLDFLAGSWPAFSKLRSPIMRRTVAKVATLQQVASFGSVPLAELLTKIKAEIERVTKEEVTVEAGEKGAEPVSEKEARLEVLKDIIRELHKGGNLEELKRRFAELIKDVNPTEISEMEQRLIEEGMPETEVKRLCDVHVQVFKESLEGQPLPTSIPGHPLHTLTEENRALERVLAELRSLLAQVVPADAGAGSRTVREGLLSAWTKLAEVEKHYLKKENQLFPLLEARGVSGPSKVMWAIHDDVRAELREFRKLLNEGKAAELVKVGRRLNETVADMIYKEEKILFPMCLEKLDEKDWARVKRGEEEIGYAWVTPGREWKPAVSPEEEPLAAGYQRPPRKLDLDTGALTPEQVNLILKNLPVDVTFVDEHDTVVYYSASPERIFPRSAAIIGRKVQNCHPPDSVHIVNRILASFKEGRRDVAEFWIGLKDRFIHIRYFAVRDDKGTYLGCLEVNQDVTSIRQLIGEKRLLDWE